MKSTIQVHRDSATAPVDRILLLSMYELGHTPNGLAMPMAFLERAGFAAMAQDLAVEPLDEARVKQAQVIAVSVPMHTALRLAVRLMPRLRAINPSCQVVFFGLYASLHATHLREIGVNWVLGGECEADLCELVIALDRTTPPAPPRQSLARLDFPIPRRATLPQVGDYAHLVAADGGLRPAGYTEATRGCLDQCRHCPVPAVYGGRFFVVPRDIVLADIEQQIAGGAEHITFGDPDFLNGPGHAMAILGEVHRRWPAVTFDVTAQVSHLLRQRDRLPEIRALGCAFVTSAVESLSDRVLAALAKRHRRSDVEQILSICRDVGLPLRPTFVTFTPWTTLADLVELVDFIADHDLVSHVAPIQLTIRLLVPPGSLLLAEPELRKAFGPLDAAALSYVWQHPDPRVDELASRIAAMVAIDNAAQRDAFATFTEIRNEIHHVAGSQPRPMATSTVVGEVPRMTEAWFC